MLRVGRLPGQVVVAIDLHQDTAWSCMKLDVRVDDIQPRRCFDWRRCCRPMSGTSPSWSGRRSSLASEG